MSSVSVAALEVMVDEADIDTLGHVNNAAFVRFFERGRVDFYARVGLALERDTPPRLGTVVVNLNVDFRAEAFVGDRLRLHTIPRRRGNRSFVLAQRLERDDGRVVAEAEVTSVVMDLDQRSVVPMPAALATAFEESASGPPLGQSEEDPS